MFGFEYFILMYGVYLCKLHVNTYIENSQMSGTEHFTTLIEAGGAGKGELNAESRQEYIKQVAEFKMSQRVCRGLQT